MCFAILLTFCRAFILFKELMISSRTSSIALNRSSVRLSSLIMWYPKGVKIGSLISPIASSSRADSNAETMVPFGNSPRLPPCEPEPGSSECFLATSSKLAPALTFPRRSVALAFALS